MKTLAKNPCPLLGLFLLACFSGLALAEESPALGSGPKGLAASDWSSIRAAYEAGRHAVHRQENGTLMARNPGQQWRAEFDGKGFTVTPDHGRWTWGLELTGYGERTLLSFAGTTALRHEGGNITSQRDENLLEWFTNDARGLEQGWTFRQRPERADATAPLLLHLATRGGLRPQVSPDSSSVSFQQKAGGSALTYGGLKAWDADGKNLRVRFEQAEEGRIRIAIDDQSARYPITIDPVAQQAYLKASNTGASDLFGSSVAISGNTVVVGAPQEASSATGVNGNQANNSAANSGAAYVFVRSGTTWTQQAYLKASNTDAYDLFGNTVAIDGDTVVVGAYQESSNATGVNGNQADNSATDSGAAYVFVRSGTTWTQQAYLKASNAEGSNYPVILDGDRFGWSVSVSGNVVVVGARYEDSSATGVNGNQFNNAATDAGAAYVFARSGTTWTQQAYLKASNAEGGPPTGGGTISTGDNFGYSVAVSGETVVVGAYQEGGVNNLAPQSGAAYVFVRSGSAWTQQAYLKASNAEQYDLFGASVAISGNTVAVGAYAEDSSAVGSNGDQANNSASRSGAAYVFVRSGSNWSQQAYLKASNTGADDVFGISLALSGNVLVVGAVAEASNATGINGNQLNNSASRSGAAYVFVRIGAAWAQTAYLKASNTEADDNFGISVTVSGSTAVVGAFYEDSNATGINGNPLNNSLVRAGAAYVYDLAPRCGTVRIKQIYFYTSPVLSDFQTRVINGRFNLESAFANDIYSQIGISVKTEVPEIRRWPEAGPLTLENVKVWRDRQSFGNVIPVIYIDDLSGPGKKGSEGGGQGLPETAPGRGSGKAIISMDHYPNSLLQFGIELISGLFQLATFNGVVSLHPYDTLAHELGHVLLNDARFIPSGSTHTSNPKDLMCDGAVPRVTPGPFETIFKKDNEHDVIDELPMVRGGDFLSQVDAMFTSSSYVTAPTPSGGAVGDFNADGVVNAADLTLLYARMGQVSSTHDLTGDGRVSLADALELIGLIPGALLGDLNFDGQVNGIDLAALEGGWQTSGGRAAGDIDGDGLVTAVDLALLANDWQGPPVVSHDVLLARSQDRVAVPFSEISVPAWEVNWAANTGVGYQVEMSVDLQTWSPLGNQIVGDGRSVAGLVETPSLQRSGFVRLRGSDAPQVGFAATPRFFASRLTWSAQAGEVFTVESWRGSGPPGTSGSWQSTVAFRAVGSGLQNLVLNAPNGQSGGGYLRVMRVASVSE